MRFNVKQDVFEKLLKPVVKVASSNKTLQILTHIYFKVNEDSIEVIGSNGEYTVRVKEMVDVDETGNFLVLSDKFFQIIKSLPEGFVSIEKSEDSSIVVRSLEKDLKFVLQTIPTEEYPKQILDTIETSYNFEVSQGELKKIIKKLSKFCADSESIQAVFTGFLFDLKSSGDMNLVTTDTKRMGVYYSSYKPENDPIDIKFVVPADTLEVLEDVLLEEGPLKVGINYDEDMSVRNVVFSTPMITISSSVISGTFPNYEAVLPSVVSNYAVISRDELEEAVKRVSVIADKETNRVVFSFENDRLVVKTDNNIIGEASEVVPCRFVGTPEYIYFNYEFILDYLNVLDADEFYWGFNGYESVNKFWSDKEKSFVYVAMPLRR